jgi:NAD(P) transhydrogenase subunit alpha
MEIASQMRLKRFATNCRGIAAIIVVLFLSLTPTVVFADVEVATDALTTSGFGRTDALIASITIFVLAIFVGFEVITKVPPTLHTPLMSGSNAISGITIVGALIAAGTANNSLVAILGMLAVAMAAINVIGGFLVTHRMLSMFRKK